MKAISEAVVAVQVDLPEQSVGTEISETVVTEISETVVTEISETVVTEISETAKPLPVS